MTNMKTIMVASVMLAIASVGIAPLMTETAYATYATKTTDLTNCSVSGSYQTNITQSSQGSDVTVTLNVPSVVCSTNFTTGEISLKDGSNNRCTFTITAAGGSTAKSCGSSFDMTDSTLFINASIDYGTSKTVNYSQSWS